MDSQEPKNTTINSALKKTEYGQVMSVSIKDEMEKSYLDYAMSVIVSRALPDVRDGLKPVHRRILFAMKEMGLTHKTPYKKSARVVGEVLGKYHPHGDQSVYDALVRLAQEFSMRYPLVEGQGNFGSVDGDSAAAMRYTEARLSEITQTLLEDIDKETVPFIDNFDGSQQEPMVMPAKLPNLLLMGSDGIAVGMATKIPPHNLGEVVDAITTLIDKGESKISPETAAILKDPETDPAEKLIGEFETTATLDDLLHHVKGPDFPTGAEIYDQEQIRLMYETGKGKIVIRAITEINESKTGRFQIQVKELPYQVNKARLIAKIADLVRKKKLEGISDLRDESDRKGMSIAIELKRDAAPKKVLNNLYKHTELQSSFPANFVALDSHLTPRVMTLRQILMEYTKHRQLVIARRCQFELKAAKARAHILEGLLKALDHIDAIIQTIRQSPDSDTAKTNLMSKFGFSDLQAQAILDMQLRRLAALERQKIEDEYKELQKKINTLVDTLTHPQNILAVISKELLELKATHDNPRRTKVHKNKVGEFRAEDLIPEEETIVALTQTGYIKRMEKNTFKSQRRGGKGVSGMTVKDTDEIHLLLSANTHDDLLVFTSTGRVFQLKVYDLPVGSRTSKGQAIVNLINLQPEETVQSLMAMSSKDTDPKGYFFFVTRDGSVKRTAKIAFSKIKSNGLIAIKLSGTDRLVWVKNTSGDDQILLVSHQGKSIRFVENDVRPTGRDTMGVRGILLKGGDYVCGMETIPGGKAEDGKSKKVFSDLLVITESGLGKRTPVGEYPLQKRGGQGVKAAELTLKTGYLAAAQFVTEDIDEIVITTKEAQAIKLPLRNIPRLKRPTMGVILMRFAKSDDKVVAVTTLEKE